MYRKSLLKVSKNTFIGIKQWNFQNDVHMFIDISQTFLNPESSEAMEEVR